MKRILSVFVILTAAVMLTGCMQQKIVVAHSEGELETPDISVHDDIKIDWDQVMSDCETILNQEDFPAGSYLDFAVYPKENTTQLIWCLKPDASIMDAYEYAPYYIKAFNDAVATQDFSYKNSDDNYYGGYWDKWGLQLQICHEQDIMDPELFIINQYIEPGTNDEIRLNMEALQQ